LCHSEAFGHYNTMLTLNCLHVHISSYDKITKYIYLGREPFLFGELAPGRFETNSCFLLVNRDIYIYIYIRHLRQNKPIKIH